MKIGQILLGLNVVMVQDASVGSLSSTSLPALLVIDLQLLTAPDQEYAMKTLVSL